jgi:hypothetical protein
MDDEIRRDNCVLIPSYNGPETRPNSSPIRCTTDHYLKSRKRTTWITMQSIISDFDSMQMDVGVAPFPRHVRHVWRVVEVNGRIDCAIPVRVVVEMRG